MKRMLVNTNDPEEVRIAIVEDGILQELHVELANRESYLGNIYKGKVVNIEPSIGAAFINFGGNRNGFLHASDVVPAYADEKVTLMDVLEGKVHAGKEEGPEAVRQILDDAEEEVEELADAMDEEENAPQGSNAGAENEVDEDEGVEVDEEPGSEEEDLGEEDYDNDREESEPEGGQNYDDDEVDYDDADEDDVDDEADDYEDDGSDATSDDPRDVEDEEQEDDPRDEPTASMAAAPEEGATASAKPQGDSGEKSGRSRRRRRRRAPRDDRPEGDDNSADKKKGGRGQKRSSRGGSRSGGREGGRGNSRGGRGNGRREGRGRRDSGRRSAPRLPITDLLKKGQELVVQITKEGIGAKGPTLTTYLSLPGRCLVLMPSLPKCGVSRRVEDEKERRRLKRIIRDLDRTGKGGIGFIVRTAGVGKTRADLERDQEYLEMLWGVVLQRAKSTRAPAPLYVESDLVLRTMRDLFTPDIDEVVVDSEPVYTRVRDFVDKLMPRFTDRIKHHEGHAPLFHSYGLEAAVELLYEPKVELKLGGSIVIEQTEALVAIDVNSGRFKPGTSLEETAYRTNMDAIDEIVRQLRLRDLGGVIIVDFIDMMEERHRRNVERKFRDALRPDRARINVGRISIFGMLELTRQRVGPGLKRTVFQICPTCTGSGLVRTVQSKALAVLREMRALAQLPGFVKLEAYTHPEVEAFLSNRKRRAVSSIEDVFGRELRIKAEPSYPVDVVHYRFVDQLGREAKVHVPPGLGVHV